MATQKYDLEEIPNGTMGWNAPVTAAHQKIDEHLHTRSMGVLGGDVTEYEAVTLDGAGKIVRAQAGVTADAVGIALQTGVLNDDTRYHREGPVTNAAWSWTPNQYVYLDSAAAGGLTQTLPATPTQIIGMAKDATTIIVQPISLVVPALKLSGADEYFGTDAVSDPAAMTASAVTEADADDTYGTEERDLINSLKAEINNLVVDITDVHTQFTAALAAMRVTGGAGVLSD